MEPPIPTSAYSQHRTHALKIVTNQPTNWYIEMPLELGASDSDLRVEFHDGKVTAVRVRTTDGPPPKDGPRDKQQDVQLRL